MSKKRLPPEDLGVFSRQLSLVLDSDLPLQDGLALIAAQTSDTRLKTLSDRIGEAVRGGSTLSKAIENETGVLPAFFIDMTKIGEESGNLQQVLLETAEAYEKDVKTARKVRAAVTYPALLSFLMLGVVILLVTTVMPMFEDVLSSLGGEVPPFTRFVMDISAFAGDNLIIILALIAVLLLSADFFRNTAKGRMFFDRLKLKMPVQKDIVTTLAALRFSRGMSMLVRSGIPFSDSFALLAPVSGNSVFTDRINKAAGILREGRSLREALGHVGLFPELLHKLLSVAEQTGHVEKMFGKAADILEQELDERLGRLATVLEPFLIIFLSLILAVILLSVIFPVIGIMNNIG